MRLGWRGGVRRARRHGRWSIGVPDVARVHPRAAGRVRAARDRGPARRCGEGLQSRVFWILVVVLFCSSIAQNGAITHMAALLTDRGVSAGGARARAVGDGRRRAWPAG